MSTQVLGSVSSGNDSVIGEIPSGAKNGSNKVFTCTYIPNTDDDIAFYFNGFRLEKVDATPNNSQFTISGATLTLNLAPASTDVLYVDYLK